MKEDTLFITLFFAGWSLVFVLIGILYALLTQYFKKQGTKLDEVEKKIDSLVKKEDFEKIVDDFIKKTDFVLLEKRVKDVETEISKIKDEFDIK